MKHLSILGSTGSIGTRTLKIVEQFPDLFSVKALSAKHNIYLLAKQIVQFKPEHQYLVALNERGYLIGGIYYRPQDTTTYHLEKIVVDTRYRKKGISDAMMNEFFKRLESRGIKQVTTGFFRPEYFYRFGFKIERRYSGLVKNISENSIAEEEVFSE